MTSFGCAEFREIAPDLALGLLAGDERGAAIDHLTTCGRCSQHLVGLVRVADNLLLLAPAREPDIGFESRVMARLAAGGAFPTAAPSPAPGAREPVLTRSDTNRSSGQPMRIRTLVGAHRPWGQRPRLLVVVAAVLVVLVGVTAVVAGQSRGRQAGRASALRQQTQAANQLAARTVVIRADGGASTCQLVAFPRSATQLARLVIHLDQPKEPTGSYRVLADPADGGPAVTIGTIVMADGHGWLMASIPEGTGPVGTIRIVEAQTVRYRATFEPV